MGQKWMQKELLEYRQGYTNLDLNRRKGPHIIGDFKSAPFRSDWFDLILFDPPWILDRRPGNKSIGHFSFNRLYGHKYSGGFLSDDIKQKAGLTNVRNKWKANLYFETWRSPEERNLGVMKVFFEISRMLRVGGRCVFKWGSGSGMDVDKILSFRPETLQIVSIRQRRSRGGRHEVTWHVTLEKSNIVKYEPPEG
jgi:hypothetical protein